MNQLILSTLAATGNTGADAIIDGVSGFVVPLTAVVSAAAMIWFAFATVRMFVGMIRSIYGIGPQGRRETDSDDAPPWH